MSNGLIVQVIVGVLAIIGALLAAVGAFLFFMLHGMRRNQYAIWEWAKEETKELARKVEKRNDLTETQLREMWRWMRHEVRSLYGEILEIVKKMGKEGEDVEKSIRTRIKQLDREE